MMQEDSYNEVRETLSKIDNLYHVKQFKNLKQTKIFHLKRQKPADYCIQIRKMLLHIIYLCYIAQIKKVKLYMYPDICINKWGIIFRYYSFSQQHSKFMSQVDLQDFKKAIQVQFTTTVRNAQQKGQNDQDELEHPTNQQQKGSDQQNKQDKTTDPWLQFGAQMITELQNSNHIDNKDFITKLQQTKFMKNNILILGILSSTLFPLVKISEGVKRQFRKSQEEQLAITRKFFSEDYEAESTRKFVDYIVRFFKVFDNEKVLGITTTTSDKIPKKITLDQSLLSQFFITLNRPFNLNQKSTINQIVQRVEEPQTHPGSNQSSQHNYSEGNSKELSQAKCQIFWTRRTATRQLNFKIIISISKKIYPLHYNEIENIWYSLNQKWKHELSLQQYQQYSSIFNPAFITLEYDKDSYQLKFISYYKYQPLQHILTELLINVDKLVIGLLIMRDVICYYERKSNQVEISQIQMLVMNEGKLQNMAIQVARGVRNYWGYCKQILSGNQEKIKQGM